MATSNAILALLVAILKTTVTGARDLGSLAPVTVLLQLSLALLLAMLVWQVELNDYQSSMH